MLPVILFFVGVVTAIVQMSLTKKTLHLTDVAEFFLDYLIPLNIGLMSLIAFVAHTFFTVKTAHMMGWEPNSPFQFEAAMANLGLGIVGILSIWIKRGFWLSTVITYVTLAFGCAWLHLAKTFNMGGSPLNYSIYLYTNDLIIPTLLLVLALIYASKHHYFKGH
jgi:hypothetical protein